MNMIDDINRNNVINTEFSAGHDYRVPRASGLVGQVKQNHLNLDAFFDIVRGS